MSYNFSRGVQFIGDISGSEDPDRNTGIDFEDNIIRMVADGGRTLVVNHDKVGIGVDSPQHRLHISGTAGQVAGLVVGDLYVTGSRAKLVVEETDGSDYRVVIDPINGPLVHFGSDTADNHYMTLGAFSGRNNLDTKNRDFHLYGTNTTTGFYFDESTGHFGVGTSGPSSTLTVTGSNSRSIATITGVSNAIGSSHYTVLLDADSGNCAAQLPAASGIAGRIYIFKRIDGSGNHVKVQSNGSEEIEGSTNDLDINTQYESFTLQCDGTRWWIISDNHL